MATVTQWDTLVGSDGLIGCLRSAGGPTNLSGAVDVFPNRYNATNLTASSAGTRPVYVSDPDSDGKGPAFLIDTGDRGLCSNLDPAATNTMGIVFKLRGTSTDDDDYRGIYYDVDPNGPGVYLTLGTNRIHVYTGSNDNNTGAPGTLTADGTTYYYLTVQRQATNIVTRLNGSQIDSQARGTNLVDAGALGSNNGGGNGYFSCIGATCYAFVIINRALSAGDLTTFETYLQEERTVGYVAPSGGADFTDGLLNRGLNQGLNRGLNMRRDARRPRYNVSRRPGERLFRAELSL